MRSPPPTSAARRAAEEVVVEVNPDTMEFTFTAYDVDEDGNWVNERDDTPKQGRAGPHRRPDLPPGDEPAHPRGRARSQVRGVRRTARATSSPASSSRPTAATRCSTSVGSRRCCRRPSRCRSSGPSPGDRVKAYIVEVRKTAKGPQIVVSRTHPGLIKRLFELEVPEIADGIVEIKACAREPGHRTKIAVWSNDHNVDPVGACVGARGGRVRMVVNELRGEKIDIVPFSEDLADFVAKALSPAKVKEVIISDDGTQADVIVPDHQLSLAIGKEGQNARLAARLTGVRIDIRGETQPPSSGDDDEASTTPRASGSPTPRPARWSGTPPTARVITQDEWNAQAGEPRRRRASTQPRSSRPTDAAERARRGRASPRDGRGRVVTTQETDHAAAADRCGRCIGCRTPAPQAQLVRCARRARRCEPSAARRAGPRRVVVLARLLRHRRASAGRSSGHGDVRCARGTLDALRIAVRRRYHATWKN